MEYLQSSQCISLSTVSTGVHFIAIKLVCCTQRALLHQVKDLLYVDQFSIPHIKVHARAQKFSHEHWYVKPVGVIASEITTIKNLLQFMCNLFKNGGILHHFISDTVKLCSNPGNGHLGIDNFTLHHLVTVRQ